MLSSLLLSLLPDPINPDSIILSGLIGFFLRYFFQFLQLSFCLTVKKIHWQSRWYFRSALKALLTTAPQGACSDLTTCHRYLLPVNGLADGIAICSPDSSSFSWLADSGYTSPFGSHSFLPYLHSFLGVKVLCSDSDPLSRRIAHTSLPRFFP